MRSTLTRTGRIVPFCDISIGSPFFDYGRFWIRTDHTTGVELHSTNLSRETQRSVSACSFQDDDGTWLDVETVTVVEEAL